MVSGATPAAQAAATADPLDVAATNPFTQTVQGETSAIYDILLRSINRDLPAGITEADVLDAISMFLAKVGTSEKRDYTNEAAIVTKNGVEHRFMMARLVAHISIADSTLRSFARANLADRTYRLLRRYKVQTPLARRHGLSPQAYAVAFDYADGITLPLTQAERLTVPRLRRQNLTEQTTEVLMAVDNSVTYGPGLS